MWHSWFRVKSNSRGSWVLKGVKEKILIEKRKKINLEVKEVRDTIKEL